MQVEDQRKLRPLLTSVCELEPGTPFESCEGWALSLKQEYRIMILLDISESFDSIEDIPAKVRAIVAPLAREP